MNVIKIKEKFEKFSDHFNPRIVAELNGQYVKFAKLKGEFIWHSHKDEDEMFMVMKGKLYMDFRDKTLILEEGDMIVVPKCVEHRPRAEEEVQVILFEPVNTVNTGEIDNFLTKNKLEWI